jgi:hypothetical protein
MWHKTKPNKTSAPKSFHITIKMDTLEAQRRIAKAFDILCLARDDVRHHMDFVDPDRTLRRALMKFSSCVREAHGEVGRCYVPERSYLAAAVMALEDVFRSCKALTRAMKEAGRKGTVCEGWCLRASNIVAAISRAEDDMEDMRTELAKELLPSTKVQREGRSWVRLWRRGSKEEGLARAKKVEAAFPQRKRCVAAAWFQTRYYL